jgi:hypothetical protein
LAKTLYLLEARAQQAYSCAACGALIARGATHFRHDPYPQARRYRGEATTHWCYECVAAVAVPKDRIARRVRVPIVRMLSARSEERGTVALARVELIGVGRQLVERLALDPSLVHSLTPSQFEELICDRLQAMGLEPKRVGGTFQKDGGIDIIFWSRQPVPFPLLGAAQVKHHRESSTKEGVGSVRDLAGTIAGHPFNVGVLVTNTTFTPDAEWFAREKAQLLRLRGFTDVKRWLNGNFGDSEEWRELPETIEVCPGLLIPIRSLAR